MIAILHGAGEGALGGGHLLLQRRNVRRGRRRRARGEKCNGEDNGACEHTVHRHIMDHGVEIFGSRIVHAFKRIPVWSGQADDPRRRIRPVTRGE